MPRTHDHIIHIFRSCSPQIPETHNKTPYMTIQALLEDLELQCEQAAQRQAAVA
jgi:hypothetical protein